MKFDRINVLIFAIGMVCVLQVSAQTSEPRSFSSMNKDKLENLGRLYEKLGNRPIFEAIQRELTARKNGESKAGGTTPVEKPKASPPLIKDPVVENSQSISDIARIQEVKQKVEDPVVGGSTGGSSAEDAVLAETDKNIDYYSKSGRNRELVDYLSFAKRKHFSGKRFPYEKEMVEAKRDSLVQEAYQGITSRDSIKANKALSDLKRVSPQSAEVQPIEAEIALMQGDYTTGVRILKELKTKHRGPQPFPYQEQLAYGLVQAGEKEEARSEFQELATSPDTKPEVRAEAEEMIRDMEDSARGRISGLGTWTSEDEGDRFRSGVMWESGEIGDGWRMSGRYDRSDLSISPDSGRNRGRSSFNEGELFLTKWFAQGTELTLGGGASDEGGLYSARFSGGQTLTWEMVYEGNARTDEGLQLEALGAREHRGRLELINESSDHVDLILAGYGGTMRAFSQTIGDWYGGEIIISWTVYRPSDAHALSVAYEGEYRHFDIGTSDVADIPVEDLVEQVRHRHGIRSTFGGDFSNLNYSMHVGVFYDIDEKATEFGAGISLEWLLFRDLDMALFSAFDWNSDGRGANEGGNVYEAQIGLSISL